MVRLCGGSFASFAAWRAAKLAALLLAAGVGAWQNPPGARVHGGGGDVLTAPVGGEELNRRVEALALRLAAVEPSRVVSNRGGWQSAKTLHRRDLPEIQELGQQMQASALDYLRLPALAEKGGAPKHTVGPPVIEVTEAWVNVVGSGGENVWHSHFKKNTVRGARATPLVGVYYVAVGNSGPSRLLLRDDRDVEFSVTPRRGLGAFFPAQMQHAVEPHRNVTGERPGPRISVSFNLQPRWFSSAAQRAAYDGDLGEIQRLVRTREQADATDGSRDGEGRPLLLTAVEAGHLPVAAHIISLRADVYARRTNRQGVLHGVSSAAGDTSALAALLLEARADATVNAPALGGWTPIHHATAHGGPKLVEVLLSRGARTDVRNKQGQEPLHMAAAAGQAPIAQLLLEHRAAPRRADTRGREACHTAAEEGHTEVLEVLLGRDQSLPWVPVMGRTVPESGNLPVHLAAERGYLSVVKDLARLDGMLEAKGAGGQTPLHAAVRRPRADVASWLLERRADVRARDDLGREPLHLAAANGHASAIRLLLDAGADPCEATSDGMCVADLAASAGGTEAARVLRDRCGVRAARGASAFLRVV